MRSWWAVAWLGAVFGCSSAVEGVSVRADAMVTTDAAGTTDAERGEDGGAVGAVTVDEAVASLRAALCEQEARCDDERRFPLLGAPREVVELCARTGIGLRSFLSLRSGNVAVDAARAGRARVDVAALARCLAVIRGGCDEDGAQDAACAVERYVVGDLPRGAPCSVSVECGEGLWCEVPTPDVGLPTPRPVCAGVCAPRVAEGSACVSREACALPERGTRECERGRCAARVDLHGYRAVGASCEYRNNYDATLRRPCVEGAYCRVAGERAVCEAPVFLSEGEGCDGDYYQCAAGLHCALDGGRRDGVCRAGDAPPDPPPDPPPTLAAWGEPCESRSCVAYAECLPDDESEGAARRCRVRVFAAVGEPCGTDARYLRACGDDARCESGVCARRAEIVNVGEGAACGGDTRCAEGFFCSSVTGCTRPRPDGAECVRADQCSGGQCVNQRCVARYCPR